MVDRGDRGGVAAHPPSRGERLPLEDRHAVVTGGARGIGAAIAHELARLGARVTIMGRDAGALKDTAARLRESTTSSAASVVCDVSDPAAVERAFSRASEASGRVTILVNNAGQAEGGAAAELDLEVWNRMLAVNLTGSYLCVRQVLPGMLEEGAEGGRIINVASTAGLRGYARMSAYCAAKHGVVGMSRALAAETAKSGVTVNAVCPGYTDTAMARKAVENLVSRLGVTDDAALAMLTRGMPRGRLVAPEEVAALVGWLALPGSSAVTGEAIVLGGEL